MSAPPAQPTLEQILGPALAAQCRLVPPPADLRGHVLAKTNKWVPEGQDVAAWLLTNHQSPPAPTQPPPRVRVRCVEQGTARGHCHYTESYEFSGTIGINEPELQALIREAGSRADAVDAFLEWVDDNFEADDSSDESDRDYDSHEEVDRESDERSSNAEEVIEAYLNAHPELLPPEGAEVVEGDDDDGEEDEDDEDEDDIPEGHNAVQRLVDQLLALDPESPAPLATEEPPHDP